jgi:hypothetical protein
MFFVCSPAQVREGLSGPRVRSPCLPLPPDPFFIFCVPRVVRRLVVLCADPFIVRPFLLFAAIVPCSRLRRAGVVRTIMPGSMRTPSKTATCVYPRPRHFCIPHNIPLFHPQPPFSPPSPLFYPHISTTSPPPPPPYNLSPFRPSFLPSIYPFPFPPFLPSFHITYPHLSLIPSLLPSFRPSLI